VSYTCSVCNRPAQGGSPLCRIHQICAGLGILIPEAAQSVALGVHALTTRLQARASSRDSEALLHLLEQPEAASIDQQAVLDASLEILETEVLLGGKHPVRIARAEVVATRALSFRADYPHLGQVDDALLHSLFRLYSLRGRIAHMRKDFALAAAIHNENARIHATRQDELPRDSTSIERSLASASMYLNGDVRDSRRLSDELFEITADARSESAGVIVCARHLEHGIVSGEIASIHDIAADALSLAENTPADSARVAIHKVILLRDSARVLGLVADAEQALTILERALTLAVEYGLLDQVNKIGIFGDEIRNLALEQERMPVTSWSDSEIRYQ